LKKSGLLILTALLPLVAQAQQHLTNPNSLSQSNTPDEITIEESILDTTIQTTDIKRIWLNAGIGVGTHGFANLNTEQVLCRTCLIFTAW
jgi:predicted secreted protein